MLGQGNWKIKILVDLTTLNMKRKVEVLAMTMLK